MKEKTYKPRIERGISTKIWVPHGKGEIAFAYPAVYGRYREVGTKILGLGGEVPTGDHIASLIHAAYCSKLSEEPEINEEGVGGDRHLINYCGADTVGHLWVFNTNFLTEKGIYVLQDLEASGYHRELNLNELEKMLKGGKELPSGVIVSRDERLRFAPKGTYKFGRHTPESFANDGFIIASCLEEGAHKLGQAAEKIVEQDPQEEILYPSIQVETFFSRTEQSVSLIYSIMGFAGEGVVFCLFDDLHSKERGYSIVKNRR